MGNGGIMFGGGGGNEEQILSFSIRSASARDDTAHGSKPVTTAHTRFTSTRRNQAHLCTGVVHSHKVTDHLPANFRFPHSSSARVMMQSSVQLSWGAMV